MDVYSLLEQAILNKQQIHAFYNGYYREMCPHVLGFKNGKQHCLFYQFGGESSKGPVLNGASENWRCIPIEGLINPQLVDGVWQTIHSSGGKQSCIDNIAVEVQY
jgi:hypothetical protein